jgi:isocitrate/isopropylmalate dehydrogenase
MMLSAAMMLTHLKEQAASERLRNGIERVYAGRAKTTPDLGGTASTREFADAVIAEMG